jgi:hypothetical protein
MISETDNLKIELIKESLSKIIKNLQWLGAIDLIAFFGLFNQKKELNTSLGQFTIPTAYIGFFLLVILFTFVLSHYQKYDRIISLYKSLKTETAKRKARLFLNNYPSLFNHFAKDPNSRASLILDNLGIGISSTIYAGGFLLAFRYFHANSLFELILGAALVILLFAFRQDLLHSEKQASLMFKPEQRWVEFFFLVILLVLLYLLLFVFIK